MSVQYDGDYGDTQSRIYGHATNSHGARHAFLAIMLAVSVFFLVLSLSARQATESATAQRVIESGIASLTDIDRLIAEDAGALRLLAQTSDASNFAIPGYPLQVFLSRNEVTTLSNGQLRDLVLSRSSAIVYTQGVGSFDRTGNQSISRFSSQGLLKSLVGELSESTHSKATIATVVFAVLVALCAVALLAVGTGWARLRVAGIATLLGALPGLALFGFAWFMAGRIGGGDPFVQDIRSIARSVLTVPMRNFGVVAVLGAFIAATSVILGLAADRLEDRYYEQDDHDTHFDDHPGELEA